MSLPKLLIPESKDAPEVVLDPVDGVFKIHGKSFPENAEKFYRPIINWLDDLGGTSTQASNGKGFDFLFYYINSSSVFALLELLNKIKSLNDAGFSFEVIWRHDEDDDDIRRIGEDYARLTSLDIQLVAQADE